MLFLVGLMGLTAIGATMFIGGDNDDAMMEDADPVNAETETDEPMTDLGSLIPEDDTSGETATPDTVMAEQAGTDTSPPVITEMPDAEEPVDDSAAGETIADESPSDPDTDPAGEPWSIQTGGVDGERIDGGDGNEFLLGYEGDDQINGNGGMDQIEGGDGDDTLSGGADNDELHGDEGDDQLAGDAGNDSLYGHFGDDLLQGGEGDDSMVGGQGDDTLEGDAGNDALHGYHGDDVLRGGDGEDTLFGSLGDDVLSGLSSTGTDDGAVDYLNGGEGDDLIMAGAGDIVSGGEGDDQIQLSEWNTEAGPAEVMDFEEGRDNLVVLYEDGTPEPDIDVEQDSDDEELYRVLADGELIAQVHSVSPVTAQSIALVAQQRPV